MKKIFSITMLIVVLVATNTKTMMHFYNYPLPEKIPIAAFPNFTVIQDMERIAALTIYKEEAYRITGRSGGLSYWAKYKLPKRIPPYNTSDLLTKNRIGSLARELDTLDPKIKNKLLENKKFLSKLKSTKPFRGYTKKEREKMRPKKIYFPKIL